MKIKAISLINFRNYRKIDISIDSKINLLIGRNGQGKTNLLEAIWLCGYGKSYRTSNTKNLINFSNNGSELRIELNNLGFKNEIKVLIHENVKKIFLNDKRIKNRAELRKILSAVILDKDFKNNLEKSFKPRRIILDSVISNFSNGFNKKLKLYNKEIKRKNELLNSNGNNELLNFIDNRLIEYSYKVSTERKLWLSRITIFSEKILKKLNPEFKLELVFNSYCTNTKLLSEKFKLNREKEKKAKRSLSGSHKDEISFLFNGSDIFEFGSEGEKKSVSMALKISEILLLKKINNAFPIILVDEIGSEFDEERFNFFFNFIKSLEAQSFITANNKNILEKTKNQQFGIFSIIDGDCKKIS